MKKVCQRTRKYKLTELEVQLLLARAEFNIKRHRKNTRKKKPQRYYRCEFCHWYHVTSQDKGEGRGIA